MKNRYSLSLFAILACLTSTQNVTAASATKEAIKRSLSATELRTLAQKLENAEILKNQKIDQAKNIYEQTAQKLYCEFSKTIPQETSNTGFLKAGISKLIAALAAGYYLGMNHETIEKKFDEQVRPALTLSSEITLPTKEQAKAFCEETTKKLKNKIKHIALKNPDQAETITKTEENSDQENQNS
jgi:hypothetical protein